MKMETKLNQFKALKWIKMSLFSATLLTSLAGLASVGGGSGNGNGDDAFALQRLSESNPGLQPHEVLMKAFDESAGRPVELNFNQKMVSSDQEGAYLLGKEKQKIYQFMDLNDPRKIMRGEISWIVSRSAVSDGPLLGGIKENGSLYENSQTYFRMVGPVKYAYPSLVIQRKNNSFVEFRQYNNKIMIFTIKPAFKDGESFCQNWSLSGGYYTTTVTKVPSSAICSIGYIWKD
ncbi:MAG: hypothetical protein ACXVCY_18840 [Pseudobdellovibrionaceae bacterium]